MTEGTRRSVRIVEYVPDGRQPLDGTDEVKEEWRYAHDASSQLLARATNMQQECR